MWCSPFSDRLAALTTMFSRSTHAVELGKVSSFPQAGRHYFWSWKQAQGPRRC